MDNSQTEVTSQEVSNTKTKKPSIIIGLASLIIVIAVGAYYYMAYFKVAKVEPTNQLTSTENSESSETVGENKIQPTFSQISKEEYEKYVHGAYRNDGGWAQDILPECRQFKNFSEMANCEESILLASYSNLKRVGECLYITTKNGNQVNLCDDKNKESWPATGYHLHGYIVGVGYWIIVTYYEGSGYLIVNYSTGEKMYVLGKPVFSPSGNRFLAVNVADDAGYSFDGFQIWEKQGESYIKIFEHLITDWSYSVLNPVWVSDDTFYFVKGKHDSSEGVPRITDEYQSFSL